MSRRKRFSAAVQDLLGGDGMVDDTNHPSLDELERALRKIHNRLSALIGDEKARRILLADLPARERRVFEALLTRPRGRPPGDAGPVAQRNAAWLAVYKWKKDHDPTMGPWKFAQWLHNEAHQGASVRANYEKLRTLLRR
jgi:hypothetical protein